MVRDVTVNASFGSTRHKKQRTIVADQDTKEEPLADASSPFLRPILANLVDSNLEVVAEAPVWVERPERIKVAKTIKPMDKTEDRKEEDEVNSGSSGWMELEWDEMEEDELREGEDARLLVRIRHNEPQEGEEEGRRTCWRIARNSTS